MYIYVYIIIRHRGTRERFQDCGKYDVVKTIHKAKDRTKMECGGHAVRVARAGEVLKIIAERLNAHVTVKNSSRDSPQSEVNSE